MPAQTDYPDVPAVAAEPTSNGAPPDAIAMFRKLREIHAGSKPTYNKAAWTQTHDALVAALADRVEVQPVAPEYLTENVVLRAVNAVQGLGTQPEQGQNYSNGMYEMRRLVIAELRKMLPTKNGVKVDAR